MTTTDTAALVRKMREALIAVESSVDIGLQRRKAIADADQWLAQQRGPLTDDEIDTLMPPPDGTAEANKEWTTMDGGFPCVEFDEVDAWSRDLVIATVRSALRAYGIGQPDGEDKPC